MVALAGARGVHERGAVRGQRRGHEDKDHEEEAEELLGQLPECRLCWEKDERRREETYRRIINHSDARGMLCMIRTITDYGRERVLEGRRMPAMDGRYLKAAEDNLYAELSIAMEIPRSALKEYMAARMGELSGALQAL